MIERISTAPARALARASAPLDHALRGISDLGTRRAVILDRIRAAPADTARDLDAIVRGAMNGSSRATDGVVAFASALIVLHDAGEEAQIEALRAAARADNLLLAALLAEGPAHREISPHGRLREVCIPERGGFGFLSLAPKGAITTVWAARWVELNIATFIAHPSPIFVGRLLRERWLRPRDAVFVAARRPSTPAIALEIGRSDRWLQRLEVREALVQNPFTPTSLCASLLPSVRFHVLRHVRDAGDVHPLVATAARLLIEAVRG